MSPIAGGEDGKSTGSIATDGKDAKPKLSKRDQEIIMAAWICFKGPEPQVDYEKLASFLRLKNAHTASTIFYNVKKKIKLYQSLSSYSVSPTTRKPKAPRKIAGIKVSERTTAGNASKRTKTEPETQVKEEVKEEQEVAI